MAGTFCTLSSTLPRFFDRKEVHVGKVTPTSDDDERARRIMNWLGRSERPLRSVLLRLELDGDGVPRASYQFLAGNVPHID